MADIPTLTLRRTGQEDPDQDLLVTERLCPSKQKKNYVETDVNGGEMQDNVHVM